MSAIATQPTAPVPSGVPSTPAPGAPIPAEPFRFEDTSGLPSSTEAFDTMFPSGDKKPEEKKDPSPPKPATDAPAPAQEPPKKPSLDEGLPSDAPNPPEPVKDEPEPRYAPELRKAYHSAKEALAAKDAELAALKAQLAKPAAPLNGEAEKYTKEIETLKSRLSEYETEIKFADYSRSAEYREQYQAPLESAVKTAADDLASFTVTQADGTERPAAFADLRPLLTLQPGAAWKQAREIFGDAAPAIMRYRDQIVGLNQKAQSALDEFRTKGAERIQQTEQAQAAEEAKAAEERIKTFDGHIGSRVQATPALYGEDPADPEGNKLLESGRKLVDIAFKGSDSVDDGDLVRIQAEVAARATGFGRMVHRNRQLQAKVDELTKRLSSYEKSEPGKGDKDAGASEPPSDKRDWEIALDNLPSVRR